MYLVSMLISCLLSLNEPSDTVRVNKRVSQMRSINQSEMAIDKLDSLIIKFNKVDSLIKKQ